MMRIFVERQEADVNESFSTLMTAVVDDIKNFGSREGTFSKVIILPGSARNNKIFGAIYHPAARNDYSPTIGNVGTNFNPAVSARCVLLSESVQIAKGIIRVLRVIVNGAFIEYEVQIVGELGGFAAKMGANKLSDLDFSDYDHEYNVTNITNSWSNYNAGAGYVYPHIDYGNYSTGKKDWKVGTFRPALFVKEYIEKIAAAAGYTLDFDLILTERLKRWAVPHNRKVLTAQNTLVLDRASTDNTVTGVTAADAEFNAGTGTLGAFTTSDDKTFTYTGSTTISVQISFELNIEYTAYPITLRIMKNGVPVENFIISSDGHYTFTSQTFDISTSNTLRFEFIDLTSSESLLYLIAIKANTATAIPTEVLIGDDVKLNDTIPANVLQKDFFASIMKLFNLYCVESTDIEKHLIVKPFPDFYTTTIEDWSLKVDRSKPIIYKPMSELNARYYNFKFKQDNDYWNDLYRKRYNEGYGDRVYDSQFEFTSEKSDVEIIFAATPIVGYAGEDKVYSTIFKRTGNEPSVTEESIDSVIRIVQLKHITGVSSWKIRNASNSADLDTRTDYLYAGHLDDPDTPSNDLNFGAPKELFFTLSAGSISTNQFNVYWSPYMAEITDKDSKLMTCTIRLTKMDWYNLRFDTYKWIDGCLWRLNKVSDYNATKEDTCTAEFLKVINKTY